MTTQVLIDDLRAKYARWGDVKSQRCDDDFHRKLFVGILIIRGAMEVRESLRL
jgi:hypothetical protein